MDQKQLTNIYSYLIGKRWQEANDLCRATGFWMRVAIRDGEYVPLDSSYKEHRLNVEMKDGTVISVLSIG